MLRFLFVFRCRRQLPLPCRRKEKERRTFCRVKEIEVESASLLIVPLRLLIRCEAIASARCDFLFLFLESIGLCSASRILSVQRASTFVYLFRAFLILCVLYSKSTSSFRKEGLLNLMLAVNVAVVGPPLDEIALPCARFVCSDSIGTPCEYLVTALKDTPCSRGTGFAHATLAQLFINEGQIPEMLDIVEEQIRTVASQRTNSSSIAEESISICGVHCGPVFATEPVPFRLPSLVIDKFCPTGEGPSWIQRLHETLTDESALPRLSNCCSLKGDVDASCGQCFSSTWPGNDASVQWASSFFSNSSGREKYFPHVTLGASAAAVAQAKCLDFSLFEEKDSGNTVVEVSSKYLYSAARRKYVVPIAELSIVVAVMGNFCSCNHILKKFSLS